MRAGPMTLPVQVDAPTLGRDAAGGVTTTWATVRTCWTQPRQSTGDERESADRETATETVELWGHLIDWQDIDTTHRVLIDSRQFDIRRIDKISTRGAALIVCTLHTP